MGRPLKELPAPKEVNGNILEQSLPELKDIAFSLVFDEKTKKYAALKIPFDFETQTFGPLEIVEENTDKHLMEERLQIEILKNL